MKSLPQSEKIKKYVKKDNLKSLSKTVFWFLVGAVIGIILIVNSVFIIFHQLYQNEVYPGVKINGIDFGGKKQSEVEDFFKKKNEAIANSQFIFSYKEQIATVSAKEIDFGYNPELMSSQAISVGRSKNGLTDVSIILQSFLNGINLPPTYKYTEEKVFRLIEPITKDLEKEAVEALFQFENGRVTSFRASQDGQTLDKESITRGINNRTFSVMTGGSNQKIYIPIRTKVLKPKITTEKVNNMGIKEMIGYGTSTFLHSIPGRIHNVTLAASRLNGILIAPGQTFSFNEKVGDVSSVTGYKPAYVIKNGRTVLGDGGGVCQVSTTLFRAVLNSGLPIIERAAHAYRVGYYEQDSGPGLDATVYDPSPDFKFKNDTKNYILIQSFTDLNALRLSFVLYGTSDNRQVEVTKPVIVSQTAPPPPLYQDDPNLPKGYLEQVDHSAWGANVFFTRKVKKDGNLIIDETFRSIYRPWQDVYIRGTKEG